MKKRKSGISLIVLVITIVVIIILASAVILNVTKNNPMDSAKIAKLMQEKENLDSSMQMYLAKVMSNTLGEYSTKEIITGESNGYGALVKGDELSSDTLILREADSQKIKEELDITLPKTGNNEKIKWYINIPTGTFYLIHDSAKDYANYLGKYDSETEVLENVSLARFVMTKKSMQVKEESDVIPPEDNEIANAPELMEGMTGIYWDESGNEVEVTEENESNWYNYKENKWANAKTKDGSYWVWIPRYEYKITYFTDETKTVESQDVTKYGKIDVKFIPTSQVVPDEGYTYIHPAFRDGRAINYMNGEWDREIPGFWVAKYAAGFQANTTDISDATVVINSNDEVAYTDKNYTSYNSGYSTNALSQDLSNLPKMSCPVFKPLTYAYNCITIGDSYTLAQEIAKASNFYGLDSSSTDSHMMKNSEWGAVAYLTQSKYGRNGVKLTANIKNINNNNLNIYAITGYENETPNGVGSSSTGNKSGVFDLSGCAWERTAAYISVGSPCISEFGQSYASSEPNENGYRTLSTKYVTVYPYDSTNNDDREANFTKYKSLKSKEYGYGDAILETSINGIGETSWEESPSYFIDFQTPFFIRGGSYANNSETSIFSYGETRGTAYISNSFRAVLIHI